MMSLRGGASILSTLYCILCVKPHSLDGTANCITFATLSDLFRHRENKLGVIVGNIVPEEADIKSTGCNLERITRFLTESECSPQISRDPPHLDAVGPA